MEDYWDHSYEATTKETWGLDFRRGNDVIKTDYGKYSTDLFTDEARSIINQHDPQTPMYLYLPYQAVHSANSWKPLEAPVEYYNRFSHIKDKNRRTFAAMVSALDNAVGLILGALLERGMLNNTIIAFSTDNGGPPAGFDMNHASNAPLRGTKASLWEGGIRGCGFLWSPLLEKSGYTYSQMMQVTDWLPTLLNAAGYDMTKVPKNIDGLDQWYYLNQHFNKSMRTEILHNIDDKEEEWAIRHGDMKLLHGKGTTKSWDKWYQAEELHKPDQTLKFSPYEYHTPSSASKAAEETAPAHMFRSPVKQILAKLGRKPVRDRPFIITCNNKPANASTNCRVSEKPCLYNITADPCEYNNLAGQLPDVVESLMKRLEAHNATAVPPGNKPQDPAGFPIHHGGIWVPWVKLNRTDHSHHQNVHVEN